MFPKISIIVPVYNVEHFLDKCMESIVNQTYKNLEIIMVDDGSPDNCPQLCNEWAKKDDRIIVIHKKNAGLGMARNSGLEVATGEYIIFTDSDDYLSIDMVETLYDALVKYNVESVYCGINKVDSKGGVLEVDSIYPESVFVDDDVIDKLLLRMMGNKPELDDGTYIYMAVHHELFSAKIIHEHSLAFQSEREYMCEDLIFQIDYLSCAHKVAYIPDHLYYYVTNDGSLSTRFDPTRFERLKDFYHKLINRLSKIMKQERYKTIADGWFLSMVRGQLMNTVKRNDNKAISKIKAITGDPIVQSVIKEYPYKKNPIKRRIFNFLVDKKMNVLLYFVIKMYLAVIL